MTCPQNLEGLFQIFYHDNLQKLSMVGYEKYQTFTLSNFQFPNLHHHEIHSNSVQMEKGKSEVWIERDFSTLLVSQHNAKSNVSYLATVHISVHYYIH